MEQYLGVVFAAAFGSIIFAALFLLHRFLRPAPGKLHDAYEQNKASTYECGVEPTGDARRRFPAKFFLVAMLFVVFDLEGVLILPWAATFQKLGMIGFAEMVMFVLVLTLGLAYVWRKGALEW